MLTLLTDLIFFSSSSEVSVDVEAMNTKNAEMSEAPVEQDWEDIDAKNMKDIFQVAMYAPDIFEYYKRREVCFIYFSLLCFANMFSCSCFFPYLLIT